MEEICMHNVCVRECKLNWSQKFSESWQSVKWQEGDVSILPTPSQPPQFIWLPWIEKALLAADKWYIWENRQVKKCIFYSRKHLKSLKTPAPFSLPTCFLSDNNLFQVELPWLAASYHTFGLENWILDVLGQYFLIIHKLALDWSRLQQNTQFTPECSKSFEPCFRKLTFTDYYDLQTVATSLKWVFCRMWWQTRGLLC